jgi:hypothetical protein
MSQHADHALMMAPVGENDNKRTGPMNLVFRP